MGLFVQGSKDASAGCISWLSRSFFVWARGLPATFIDVLLLFLIHVVTLQSACADIQHQVLCLIP